MLYGMNPKEEWDALSIDEQVALREACLHPWVSLGWAVDGGFVGPMALESLCDKDFLEPEINGSCYATEDGRAVFEAGNPQADAVAAFDPYDYSVMTAAELLDIVRTIWNEYDLSASAEMIVSLADEHRLKLALAATPTDELAALRAQLADAQAASARLREALARISERAPDERPVKDSSYNWDNLGKGRERGIASSAHIYGEGMAWWYAAEIARAALRAADAGSEGG